MPKKKQVISDVAIPNPEQHMRDIEAAKLALMNDDSFETPLPQENAVDLTAKPEPKPTPPAKDPKPEPPKPVSVGTGVSPVIIAVVVLAIIALVCYVIYTNRKTTPVI